MDNTMGDNSATLQKDSPTKNGKRRKSGSKQFEQLMTAGSIHSAALNKLTPHKQVSTNTQAQHEEETKKESAKPQEVQQKEFFYKDPGVKIGNGKFGPVNLIIVNSKLCALKIVPKTTIDKTKRIEHVKNEKYILQLLRKNARDEFALESGSS